MLKGGSLFIYRQQLLQINLRSYNNQGEVLKALWQRTHLFFGTVQLFDIFKGGSIFEISPTIESGYVHAGRLTGNKQSEFVFHAWNVS